MESDVADRAERTNIDTFTFFFTRRSSANVTSADFVPHPELEQDWKESKNLKILHDTKVVSTQLSQYLPLKEEE